MQAKDLSSFETVLLPNWVSFAVNVLRLNQVHALDTHVLNLPDGLLGRALQWWKELRSLPHPAVARLPSFIAYEVPFKAQVTATVFFISQKTTFRCFPSAHVSTCFLPCPVLGVMCPAIPIILWQTHLPRQLGEEGRLKQKMARTSSLGSYAGECFPLIAIGFTAGDSKQ